MTTHKQQVKLDRLTRLAESIEYYKLLKKHDPEHAKVYEIKMIQLGERMLEILLNYN